MVHRNIQCLQNIMNTYLYNRPSNVQCVMCKNSRKINTNFEI